MVAGASFSGSPSASSVHLNGVQHASSHMPMPGYGLPSASQPPAQWWDPMGPPLPWAQYYQQWPPLLPPAAPNNLTNAYGQNNSPVPQGNLGNQPANQPPVASYSTQTQADQSNQTEHVDQQVEEPLVNTLAVSTVPGKQYEPILSMHVSQSVKKRVWAGEYIDLAYLLETNPVPEDEKSYKFACISNSTNKLSLTTAKPKAKIDSYNSWNKAFRVLTEIVTLCDPSQCLPMVQYAAELNDNIGKFTFPVTYQYDMKFRLKKQIKPQTPWNVIDNHLWSKCFSGAAKETYHHNNQPGNNFCSQRTCDDFNYRS